MQLAMKMWPIVIIFVIVHVCDLQIKICKINTWHWIKGDENKNQMNEQG